MFNKLRKSYSPIQNLMKIQKKYTLLVALILNVNETQKNKKLYTIVYKFFKKCTKVYKIFKKVYKSVQCTKN